MKKVRVLAVTFAVAVMLVITVFSTGAAHAATFKSASIAQAHATTKSSSSAIASTCISSMMPTINLMGSHVYLEYQSLNYAYTAFFQAYQTGFIGQGTFNVGWWIFQGNKLISSKVIQGWNAFSPTYYPITGLEVGPVINYGSSPTEFFPGVYNCGGYWWPGKLVTI